MNNKEKRLYISRLLAYSSVFPLHVAEAEDRKKIINSIPNHLFKYCTINEHSINALKTQKVYCSPPKLLNDPFDLFIPKEKDDDNCWLDYIKEHIPRKKIIRQILLCIKKSNHCDIVLPILEPVLLEKETDSLKVCNQLYETGWFTYDECYYMFNMAYNFYKTFDYVIENNDNRRLIENMRNDFEGFGVFCMTEHKNTRPMWAHYGDEYKGICIEYAIPKTKEIVERLFPVLYEKPILCRLPQALTRLTIGILSRAYTDGKIVDGTSAIVEEFCTKSSDWAYEKEWRIVGKEKSFVSGLAIKNVYLGYRVSEDNKKTIIDVAKDVGFDVYEMGNPRESGRLIFTKLKI